MGECFANETVQWCGKVWNWGNQNGSKLLIFSYSNGYAKSATAISPS